MTVQGGDRRWQGSGRGRQGGDGRWWHRREVAVLPSGQEGPPAVHIGAMAGVTAVFPGRPGPAAARPRHREQAGRGIHVLCSFAHEPHHHHHHHHQQQQRGRVTSWVLWSLISRVTPPEAPLAEGPAAAKGPRAAGEEFMEFWNGSRWTGSEFSRCHPSGSRQARGRARCCDSIAALACTELPWPRGPAPAQGDTVPVPSPCPPIRHV